MYKQYKLSRKITADVQFVDADWTIINMYFGALCVTPTLPWKEGLGVGGEVGGGWAEGELVTGV